MRHVWLQVSNLAATCPSNKLDAACDGLAAALGVRVDKVSEETLLSAFEAADEAAACAPKPVRSAAARPGASGAFGFAKKFGKCECPKCVVPPAPTL